MESIPFSISTHCSFQVSLQPKANHKQCNSIKYMQRSVRLGGNCRGKNLLVQPLDDHHHEGRSSSSSSLAEAHAWVSPVRQPEGQGYSGRPAEPHQQHLCLLVSGHQSHYLPLVLHQLQLHAHALQQCCQQQQVVPAMLPACQNPAGCGPPCHPTCKTTRQLHGIRKPDLHESDIHTCHAIVPSLSRSVIRLSWVRRNQNPAFGFQFHRAASFPFASLNTAQALVALQVKQALQMLRTDSGKTNFV